MNLTPEDVVKGIFVFDHLADKNIAIVETCGTTVRVTPTKYFEQKSCFIQADCENNGALPPKEFKDLYWSLHFDYAYRGVFSNFLDAYNTIALLQEQKLISSGS